MILHSVTIIISSVDDLLYSRARKNPNNFTSRDSYIPRLPHGIFCASVFFFSFVCPSVVVIMSSYTIQIVTISHVVTGCYAIESRALAATVSAEAVAARRLLRIDIFQRVPADARRPGRSRFRRQSKTLLFTRNTAHVVFTRQNSGYRRSARPIIVTTKRKTKKKPDRNLAGLRVKSFAQFTLTAARCARDSGARVRQFFDGGVLGERRRARGQND